VRRGVGLLGKGTAAALAAAILFAAAGRGAECAGDECQVPPAPPAEVIPATAAVEGPANPPVHFPKPHKKRHKHHKGRHQARR